MTSLYILLLHTVISKGYSSWNNALVRSWKIWLYWIVFSFQLTFYLILKRDLKIIFQQEESTSTAGQKLAAQHSINSRSCQNHKVTCRERYAVVTQPHQTTCWDKFVSVSLIVVFAHPPFSSSGFQWVYQVMGSTAS